MQQSCNVENFAKSASNLFIWGWYGWVDLCCSIHRFQTTANYSIRDV